MARPISAPPGSYSPAPSPEYQLQRQRTPEPEIQPQYNNNTGLWEMASTLRKRLHEFRAAHQEPPAPGESISTRSIPPQQPPHPTASASRVNNLRKQSSASISAPANLNKRGSTSSAASLYRLSTDRTSRPSTPVPVPVPTNSTASNASSLRPKSFLSLKKFTHRVSTSTASLPPNHVPEPTTSNTLSLRSLRSKKSASSLRTSKGTSRPQTPIFFNPVHPTDDSAPPHPLVVSPHSPYYLDSHPDPEPSLSSLGPRGGAPTPTSSTTLSGTQKRRSIRHIASFGLLRDKARPSLTDDTLAPPVPDLPSPPPLPSSSTNHNAATTATATTTTTTTTTAATTTTTTTPTTTNTTTIAARDDSSDNDDRPNCTPSLSTVLSRRNPPQPNPSKSTTGPAPDPSMSTSTNAGRSSTKAALRRIASFGLLRDKKPDGTAPTDTEPAEEENVDRGRSRHARSRSDHFFPNSKPRAARSVERFAASESRRASAATGPSGGAGPTNRTASEPLPSIYHLAPIARVSEIPLLPPPVLAAVSRMGLDDDDTDTDDGMGWENMGGSRRSSGKGVEDEKEKARTKVDSKLGIYEERGKQWGVVPPLPTMQAEGESKPPSPLVRPRSPQSPQIEAYLLQAIDFGGEGEFQKEAKREFQRVAENYTMGEESASASAHVEEKTEMVVNSDSDDDVLLPPPRGTKSELRSGKGNRPGTPLTMEREMPLSTGPHYARQASGEPDLAAISEDAEVTGVTKRSGRKPDRGRSSEGDLMKGVARPPGKSTAPGRPTTPGGMRPMPPGGRINNNTANRRSAPPGGPRLPRAPSPKPGPGGERAIATPRRLRDRTPPAMGRGSAGTTPTKGDAPVRSGSQGSKTRKPRPMSDPFASYSFPTDNQGENPMPQLSTSASFIANVDTTFSFKIDGTKLPLPPTISTSASSPSNPRRSTTPPIEFSKTPLRASPSPSKSLLSQQLHTVETSASRKARLENAAARRRVLKFDKRRDSTDTDDVANQVGIPQVKADAAGGFILDLSAVAIASTTPKTNLVLAAATTPTTPTPTLHSATSFGPQEIFATTNAPANALPRKVGRTPPATTSVDSPSSPSAGSSAGLSTGPSAGPSAGAPRGSSLKQHDRRITAPAAMQRSMSEGLSDSQWKPEQENFPDPDLVRRDSDESASSVHATARRIDVVEDRPRLLVKKRSTPVLGPRGDEEKEKEREREVALEELVGTPVW